MVLRIYKATPAIKPGDARAPSKVTRKSSRPFRGVRVLRRLERDREFGGLENIPGELIFNCDESGFSSDPSKVRAIGVKGVALSRISDASGRAFTSVLARVSGDRFFLPLREGPE